MILTHPHADHVSGFADLLEEYEPTLVAVTGLPAPGKNLVWEANRLARECADPKAGSSAKLAGRRVLEAILAVERWENAHPGRLAPIHDGTLFKEASGLVRLFVRSPDVTYLQNLWKSSQARESIVDRSNWLSAVVEVKFGETRIVLGGDLPRRDSGQVVQTGWNLVMGRYSHLGDHQCLKIPHHGSRDAIHPDLMVANDDAGWVLTPFNSSRLPRLDDEDGLDQLLARQSKIMITAPSLSKKFLVAAQQSEVDASLLAHITHTLNKGGAFRSGDTVWRAGSACEPLDAVWALAFDDQSDLCERWQGEAALEIRCAS